VKRMGLVGDNIMDIWIVWKLEPFTLKTDIVKIFRNKKDAETLCHNLIDENPHGIYDYSLSKEYVEG
jgi:hypothetical protein